MTALTCLIIYVLYMFDKIMLQVVGSDSDDVFYHFKEVRQYCKATCGQHVHDVLDRISDTLKVSCMTACLEY